MSKRDGYEPKETFGSNVGEGIGCFWIAIALLILFNMGRILDLIEWWLKK